MTRRDYMLLVWIVTAIILVLPAVCVLVNSRKIWLAAKVVSLNIFIPQEYMVPSTGRTTCNDVPKLNGTSTDALGDFE